MTRRCFGLDLGTSAVRLVQLRQARSGLRVARFGVEPLAPGCIEDGQVVDHDATVAAVRRVLARVRPLGRDVALAVAGNGVIIKRFAVPQLRPEALVAQIAWEADQIVAPQQRGEVLVDHTILRENPATGEIEVLLVAAKHDIVRQRLRVAQDCGLRPVVVDAAAFALHNCVEAAHGLVGGETAAVLAVGASTSTITIIADGVPAYGRDFGAGGRDYDAAIQQATGASASEAEALKRRAGVEPEVAARLADVLAPVSRSIAGEVQRSLAFFLDSTVAEPLARIYLAGGAATTPTLAAALAERLGAAAQRVEPFARLAIDAGVDAAALEAEGAAAALAFGLALRREDDSP
ncbi:type IV pilus assembly protein PilM [Nannocystis punicea]|uniref:Type IV pilus assembly protein PilM n=1 Tax=Nannocystis punicea TaxID=2995304 RepID=A0ABY7H190_9BACT|nr:type IV pilus assembly protein PilM [Nannocystis poenicansa]WAS93016.1 type IV pilus assembly protein PilM [Nannocystis poenicansa]